MRVFVPAIFIFFMFAVSCNDSRTGLSVMTFNIRYNNPADGQNRWQNRIPVVSAYLDSVAPDIAGMQEVIHDQVDEVIENGIFLSDHWPVVAKLRY